MKKRILSLILALSMVLSVLPLGAFAEDPLPELVMGTNGLPDTTNVQKTSFTDSDGKTKDKYTGSGWEYTKDPSDPTDTGRLTLTSGAYDFSFTHPQNKTGTQPAPAVMCEIEIEWGAEITGGDFAANVTNRAGGTISGGTFESTGSVTNNAVGTISDSIFMGNVTNNTRGKINRGTFNSDKTVTNYGTISSGTFQSTCKVTNYGTISDGTFQNTCSVTNKNTGTYTGTISGGTFQNTCSVENWGIIDGKGTFNGEVTNNRGGYITNGTFEQEVINNAGGEMK